MCPSSIRMVLRELRSWIMWIMTMKERTISLEFVAYRRLGAGLGGLMRDSPAVDTIDLTVVTITIQITNRKGVERKRTRSVYVARESMKNEITYITPIRHLTTMLSNPLRTTLGPDPAHRTHALNGYAFQQDALHTFNGWQYACFYGSSPSSAEPLFVHLSRRKLPAGPWQTLVFEDYAQTTDDGHNTVQLGICPGDGTIHLSYDHHCDVLRYRHSGVGVATSPEEVTWGPELFTPTLSMLPGLSSPETTELLSYITYPRFVTRGGDLLFTFRTGKAGLGDDHLCVYTAASSLSADHTNSNTSEPAKTEVGAYEFLGTHLKGVSNNPYIHGLDAAPDGSRLYTTWVYREFVHYE
ncbi:hypothetical protein CHU98_g12253, partial [Xylaria longipes]